MPSRLQRVGLLLFIGGTAGFIGAPTSATTEFKIEMLIAIAAGALFYLIEGENAAAK